jgi:hypothetical protein
MLLWPPNVFPYFGENVEYDYRLQINNTTFGRFR